MKNKLREFLDTKGRRIAELKVRGGSKLVILGQSDELSQSEIEEYKTLAIQLDSLIWAFEPKTNKKEYFEEIKKFFSQIEEPYYIAKTYGKLPKGYA
jgi:hypothetical protein